MASRYSISLEKTTFENRFNVIATEDYRPRYNAAPSQLLPVIANFSPEGASFFHWGQSPARAKNKTISDKLIHASLAWMSEKVSFHRALKSNRCIIPADGFYVWKSVGKKGKIPYRVVLNSGEAFGMPGIWEEYEDENDRKVFTFKIITITSNNVVGEIDPEMPAILQKEQERLWLDNTTPTESLLAILQGSRVEAMSKFTISPKINAIEIDDPSVMLPAPAADQFGNYSLFE